MTRRMREPEGPGGWFWAWFAFCTITGLALMGTLIYVVVHFALKF